MPLAGPGGQPGRDRASSSDLSAEEAAAAAGRLAKDE